MNDSSPGGSPASGPTFLGHPRGLATLFMTEIFERFTYYGMRALLVLFLVAATDGSNPGFGIDRETAGAVYGLYTGAVLPRLAARRLDRRPPARPAPRRVLGRRDIAIGNLILAIPATPAVFYIGLATIVVGVGLLKPNISAIVGALYEGQSGARRDAGFSIFYMGINLGALLAPLVAGTIGEAWNWRAGFLCAGLAMALGVIQYKVTERYLGTAGSAPVGVSAAEQRRGWRAVILGLVAVGAFAVLMFTGVIPVSVKGLAQLFTTGMIVIGFVFFGYMLLLAKLGPGERGRVAVIAVFFLCAALFWAGFEQAATTFNLFAQDYTDRSLMGGLFPDGVHPASWYQSAEPDLRRAVRAVLRLAVGRARRAQPRPVGARQVRHRAAAARRRLRDHHVGRAAGGVLRRQGRHRPGCCSPTCCTPSASSASRRSGSRT